MLGAHRSCLQDSASLSSKALAVTTFGSYSAEPVREGRETYRSRGQAIDLNAGCAVESSAAPESTDQEAPPQGADCYDLDGTWDSFSPEAPLVPLRCRQVESPKDRGWEERWRLAFKVLISPGWHSSVD